jgi:hypothetical protein
VATNDSHCRVATARWDPCEIVRAGGNLPIRRCGLEGKVVVLRAGSRCGDEHHNSGGEWAE